MLEAAEVQLHVEEFSPLKSAPGTGVPVDDPEMQSS